MHRRIANLGEKTFTLRARRRNALRHLQLHAQEPAAQLLAIFDGLARQQTDLSDLQRTMRYDRLGVNDVMLQIEKDYDNKLFPSPGSSSRRSIARRRQHFIDIARERARKLAGRIRASH